MPSEMTTFRALRREVGRLSRRVSLILEGSVDGDTSLAADDTTQDLRLDALESGQVVSVGYNAIATLYNYHLLVAPAAITIARLRIVCQGSGFSNVFNIKKDATFGNALALNLFSVNQTLNAAGPTTYTPDQNQALVAGDSLWLKFSSTSGSNFLIGVVVEYEV